jgi:hypothetical protein
MAPTEADRHQVTARFGDLIPYQKGGKERIAVVGKVGRGG